MGANAFDGIRKLRKDRKKFRNIDDEILKSEFDRFDEFPANPRTEMRRMNDGETAEARTIVVTSRSRDNS